MKIEMREIIINREVYIANDGTEFDDYDECAGYEIELLEKTLSFYDEQLNESTLNGCLFVKLATRKDVDAFIALCEWHGITARGIADEGVYSYSEAGSGGWIDMTAVIAKINGGNNEKT